MQSLTVSMPINTNYQALLAIFADDSAIYAVQGILELMASNTYKIGRAWRDMEKIGHAFPLTELCHSG